MARLFNVTFGARDPIALGRFWSQALGSRPVDVGSRGEALARTANGIAWFVLTDPEGNEFCVGGEP